jgi:2-isopropylmalate synthase
VIEIGPMSGRSNIVYWLAKRSIPSSDEIIDRIFAAAKQSDTVLTEQQILSLVSSSARR